MPTMSYWEQTVTCSECDNSDEDREQLTRASANNCDGCGELFCSACWDSHCEYCNWNNCVECGDTITVAQYDNGDYSSCSDCGEYLCDSCCYEFGGYCESCRAENDSDDYCCESCTPRYNSSRGHSADWSRIHNWSFRPSPWSPKGDYRREVLMGIELEVGRREDDIIPAVAAVDTDESHLYLKTDGSITGLEIVSHPMTLSWARSWAGDPAGTPGADQPASVPGDQPGAFNRLLAGLRQNGCTVSAGYGLHVHVSRNAFRSQPTSITYAQAVERGLITARQARGVDMEWTFKTRQSPTHQLAWLLFLYRNRDHIDHPNQLARRNCAEWGSFEDMGARGSLKRKAYDDPTHDNRYVAVNTNNEKTYELRFFSSTLDETQFWAALEFADASVEYTRGIRSRDILRGNALKWDSFKAWVAEHKYPNLTAELNRIDAAFAAIEAERKLERERLAERQRRAELRRERENAQFNADVHRQREALAADGDTELRWYPVCMNHSCDICNPTRSAVRW